MFSIFINLFSVLDKSEKRTIYNLQFLFIFGALVGAQTQILKEANNDI